VELLRVNFFGDEWRRYVASFGDEWHRGVASSRGDWGYRELGLPWRCGRPWRQGSGCVLEAGRILVPGLCG
jgi:hypothetical protein